jgi:protocatechuate 3,4-dioxygenase beta subunit
MQRRKFAIAAAGLAFLGVMAPVAGSPAVAATTEEGSISGRIVDTRGHALAHARVAAQPLDPANGSYVITDTEADGTYTLPGLVPGRYEVGIDAGGWGEWAPGRRFEQDDAVQYRIRAGRDTVVNSVVFVAATISGKVTDAAGRPAADIAISAFDSGSRLYFPSATGADGRYSLKVRPNTGYRLTFADGQTVQYAPSGTTDVARAGRYETAPGHTTTVNQRLIVAPQLTGRLTDAAGAPVAGAHVSYTSRSQVYEFTSTDADGRYVFARMPVDDVRIRFVTEDGQEQWAAQAADWEHATWYTTSAGAVTVVDEQLLPVS